MFSDDATPHRPDSDAPRFRFRPSRRRVPAVVRSGASHRRRLPSRPRLESLEERTVLSTSTLTINAILGNASANPISGSITVNYFDATDTQVTATLDSSNSFSQALTVFTGSQVTFDATSSGSTGTEQWATGDAPITVNSDTLATLTYYDQFNETFSATTANAVFGTPMGGGSYVTASYDQFGSPVSDPTAIFDSQSLSNVWVDNGGTATMSAAANGSTGSERWQYDAAGDQPTFAIGGSGTLSASYYDQWSATLSASTTGLDAMSASNGVTASYTSFGAGATSAGIYDSNDATAWVDVSPAMTVTFDQTSSNSGSSERWATLIQPSFTLTGGGQTLSATYQDQYFEAFQATTAAGGTAMDASNYVVASYKQFGDTMVAGVYDGNTVSDWVDSASTPTISFDASSTASGSSERWQYDAAGDQPTFTPDSSTTFNPTYYDQVIQTFSAGTAAGGTAMGASNYVTASYDQFGSSVSDPTAIYDGHDLIGAWVDNGSTATMSAASNGSGGAERWQYDAAGDQPSFPISGGSAPSATYYDQWSATLQANTAAGGTAMDASNHVTASYTSFGGPATSAGFYDGNDGTAWVDVGASPMTVTFDQSSSNSGPGERWTAQTQPSFTLSAAGQALSGLYYDQVKDTFDASTVVGGPMDSSNDITVSYNQFGNPMSATVYDGSPVSDWVDYANTATVRFSAMSSGSGSSERWQYDPAGDQPTFTPDSSTTFTANYFDQFSVTFSAGTAAGGTAMGASNYVTARYDQFDSPFSDPTAIYDGQSLTGAWVDSGGTAQLSPMSTISGANERWQYDAAGDMPTFTITDNTPWSATYYDQDTATVHASTVAGGTPMDASNYVTASYAAFGGAVNDPAPIYDGQSLTFWADNGSTATLLQTSTGSTLTERWQAESQPSFTMNGVVTAFVGYNDQFAETFSAVTAAGGTPMDASNYVTAEYMQFGNLVSDPTAIYDGQSLANVWVDNGSSAGMDNASSGSGSSERWQAMATGQPIFIISGVGTQSAVYYDQGTVTFSAVTAAGGTPMDSSNYVTATYSQFNNLVNDPTAIYDGQDSTVWANEGGTVSLSQTSTGSGLSERWQSEIQPSVVASGTTTLSGTYYDQFFDNFIAHTVVGSPMDSSNAVNVTYDRFGSANNVAVWDGFMASDWVDNTSGSEIVYDDRSTGSGAGERWQSYPVGVQQSAPANAQVTMSVGYYDQYLLTVDSSPAILGMPGSTGTAFGSPVSNGGTSAFYDSGTTANATLAQGTDTLSGIDYAFNDWSGDATGTALTSSAMTMSAPMTTTANWLLAPSFSMLSSPTIDYGTATTQVFGMINDGTAMPLPSGQVAITLDGATQDVWINTTDGTFSASFDTHTLLPAGSPYTISFAYAGDASYAGASGTSILIVNKATPTIEWTPSPATITYGTPLSAGQLDAIASTMDIPTVDGTFIYSQPSGTILNAGSQTLTVTFIPYDLADFNSASGTTTLTVNKADATIDVTPYSVAYDGMAHTAIGTAAGVGGQPLGGLDLGSTTHTNAGSYSGDTWTFTDTTGNYNDASGEVNDAIAKADATIVVRPYGVTYTGTPHTATGSATGVGGALLGGLDLSGTTHANAGSYSGDAWTFTDTTGNYNDAQGTVDDSISRAALTITAANAVKTYGATWVPAGNGFVPSGLVGGDTVSSVTLTSGGAPAPSSVGNYPIIPSNAVGAGLSNYSITYTNGLLTVNPAPSATAFVTASGASVYGQDVPLVVQVTSPAPGAPTPPGDVVFFSDGVAIATVALDAGGRASLDASALSMGRHSISASFRDGSDYLPSSASPINWQLSPASTSSDLSITPVRNARGRIVSVILTADIGAVAPGGGQPQGVVTFYRGNRKQVGVGVLDGGVATLRLSANQAMGNSFWVNYGGDADFLGSSSTPLPINRSSIRAATRAQHAITVTAPGAFVRPAAARFSHVAMGVLPSFHHNHKNHH